MYFASDLYNCLLNSREMSEIEHFVFCLSLQLLFDLYKGHS